EIVTVSLRFRAIEIDGRTAGIKQRRAVLLAQDCPWVHRRFVRQHTDAAPDEFDPWRIRLSALDHDADWNTQQWLGGRAHVAASRCLIGKPVSRFCGFIRTS